MNYSLLLICCVLLFSSCDFYRVDQNPEVDPVYSIPEVVPLNTSEGYEVNTVTGEKINVLLNPKGDTIPTGKPIPVIGKSLKPEYIHEPVLLDVKKTEVIPAFDNIVLAPDKLPTALPERDTLMDLRRDVSETISVLRNSIGDTIPSGVPIPIQGTKVPYHRSKPIVAKHSSLKNNFQIYDVDDGLNASNILAVFQDSQGNMWLGSETNGVSKFDGVRFTYYTIKEGLAHNKVHDILEDKLGNMWFATDGGLCSFNGKHFTKYTEKDGLLRNNPDKIIEDSAGGLWFCSTHWAGVSKLDGKTITHYSRKEGLPSNGIIGISKDENGNIYCLTRSLGVGKFDGKRFINILEEKNWDLVSFDVMAEKRSGNLWFSLSDAGAAKYDGNKLVHYTKKHGLTHTVEEIFEDDDGNLWFGGNGGVTKYDGEQFKKFTEDEGLSHNYVNTVFEDNDGNIWFGTRGGGVSKSSFKRFSHFTRNNGLSHNIIYPITEDSTGNLWFGVQGATGINIFDGVNFTQFNDLGSVRAILESRNDQLWIGSLGGLIKYDGQIFEQIVDITWVLDIHEDKNENLWFGTELEGLVKYENGNLTQFTKGDGLTHNRIRTIAQDRHGNMWLATWGGGVTKYTPETDGQAATFTHYTEREGLINNTVCDVMEDQHGNMWFATWGGVSKFDGSKFTHFTERDGLSNNLVYSILEDKNNNIWFGTEKGLDCLLYEENISVNKASNSNEPRGVSILNYTNDNGLNGIEFMVNSSFLDSKNRAWWGTGKNLTMLDMNSFKPSTKIPEIRLDHLEISDEFIDFHNLNDKDKSELEFDSVAKFSNLPVNLTIPFDQNHLTFYFSAIDWNAPQKIEFSYKMENLDEQWTPPSSESKADYRSLPYGEHTFRVRAIGESKRWSKPKVYTFTILAPWWHSWWARMLYVISALSIMYLLYRWRTGQLRNKQKELKNKVDLATVEIRTEKDRSDKLLLNILPVEIAKELKEKGSAEAQLIDQATVLFTDFKEFTTMCEQLSPKELIKDLHDCFSTFDRITTKFGIEKIKTIGDAYMAAGGLPTPNTTHANDVVEAAFEMRDFIEARKAKKKSLGLPFFEIRIGIHTGPVIAGIVGVNKFQYDIWGDTVNTASRMENHGVVGKLNISQETYQLLKDNSAYTFESRGKIETKGKGEIEMYFVSKA